MEETKRKLNCTYRTASRGHILKVHIERLPMEGAYEEVNIVVNEWYATSESYVPTSDY